MVDSFDTSAEGYTCIWYSADKVKKSVNWKMDKSLS